MNLADYIKPELFVVAIVCYFVGMGLKSTTLVKDKLIPLILGAVAVVLSCIYVAAATPLATPQDWFMALFTGLTQGVLMAGLSTYVNQMVKQLKKEEE